MNARHIPIDKLNVYKSNPRRARKETRALPFNVPGEMSVYVKCQLSKYYQFPMESFVGGVMHYQHIADWFFWVFINPQYRCPCGKCALFVDLIIGRGQITLICF